MHKNSHAYMRHRLYTRTHLSISKTTEVMDLSHLCKHITYIWLQNQRTEPRDICKCKLPPRKRGINIRTLGKIRIECQRMWNVENKKCEMRKRLSSERAKEKVEHESIQMSAECERATRRRRMAYVPLRHIFLNRAN